MGFGPVKKDGDVVENMGPPDEVMGLNGLGLRSWERDL